MAQKRMIDKKISVSEQVANLPIEAQLLFTWMIPHADDLGLLPKSPRSIKGMVVPMWDKSVEDVGNLLEDIEKQGLIRVFHGGDSDYYQLINFFQYQTLKKDRQPQTILRLDLDRDAEKNWKMCERMVTCGNQSLPENSTMDTEEKRSEEKRSEGEEGKGRGTVPAPAGSPAGDRLAKLKEQAHALKENREP
jgi:hypothetical protein